MWEYGGERVTVASWQKWHSSPPMKATGLSIHVGLQLGSSVHSPCASLSSPGTHTPTQVHTQVHAQVLSRSHEAPRDLPLRPLSP